MKMFNDWVLKFEKSDWTRNTEFGVIDTILEIHPEIIQLFMWRAMTMLPFLGVKIPPLLNRYQGGQIGWKKIAVSYGKRLVDEGMKELRNERIIILTANL